MGDLLSWVILSCYYSLIHCKTLVLQSDLNAGKQRTHKHPLLVIMTLFHAFDWFSRAGI